MGLWSCGEKDQNRRNHQKKSGADSEALEDREIPKAKSSSYFLGSLKVDKNVSIVIPTLNNAETLEKCLVSIVKNKSKYKYEIIVIDAGSEDGTVEIAKGYADNVFIGERGRINRNKGVESAQGDVICFTDSDCVVPENWIDELVDALLKLNKRNNRIIGVGGGCALWIENPSLLELAVIKAMTSPLVSFGARNVAIYKRKCEVLHNPPMNSAYFKWAVEKGEGFKEEYGYGGEDLELDAKLIHQGYKLYYVPQVIVRHMHRADLKKFVKQMYKHGIARIRIGKRFKEYLQFHHYGPLFLCLMTFSPLIFIPFGMALINAGYVTFKERNILLFLPIVLLTMAFYVAYGFGEIVQILRGKNEGLPA